MTEVRNLHLPIELRTEGDSPGNMLVGYAAKFNAESEPLVDPWDGGSFVEIIAPGAFARTLRQAPDVRALAQHDSGKVLGRVKAGTLRVWEDEVGLRFEVDLPDTQYARDLRASVSRGDINGCSFGFCVGPGGDSVAMIGDRIVRTLLDVDLIEISTGVTFPAYPDTAVNVRSRVPGLARQDSAPRLAAARRRRQLLDL